jgi:hypothetical protein
MGTGEHLPPVAEREQNRGGDHVSARLVVCHNRTLAAERTARTMADYNDHIGPYWPGYPGIANLVIL